MEASSVLYFDHHTPIQIVAKPTGHCTCIFITSNSCTEVWGLQKPRFITTYTLCILGQTPTTPAQCICWLDISLDSVTITEGDYSYVCMGTNNSLSLQESWTLPPSSLSLAGQTLESLARRLLLPAFLLSSPSLSFSQFSHFTHLQPEGLRTEMVSQAQLSQQHRSQMPIMQPGGGGDSGLGQWPAGVLANVPTK